MGAPAPAASEDIEPAASSSSQRRLCVVESEKDDAADGFHAATSPAASGTIEETVATPKPLSECAWVEARAVTNRPLPSVFTTLPTVFTNFSLYSDLSDKK